MLRILRMPFFLTAALTVAPAFGQTPAVSWTGFYVGANAGYGAADLKGSFDSDDIVVLPGSVISLDDLETDGIVVGPYLGANYQWRNFVLGIEADADFAAVDDETLEPDSGDESASVEINFLGSLRLRGGIAWDKVLFYATGGGAYVDGEYEVVDDINADEGGPFSGSRDVSQFGYVVGGGAEWAAWDNVSVRVEGLYYVFGDNEDTSDILGDPGPFESDLGDFVELENIFVARAGVSYGF